MVFIVMCWIRKYPYLITAHCQFIGLSPLEIPCLYCNTMALISCSPNLISARPIYLISARKNRFNMIGNTWSTIEVNSNNNLTWISVADQTCPLFFFLFVFNSTIIFFISFPQFIWFISYIINTHFFQGNIWTHNWPAPYISGFIAQLVEHRTDIARSRVQTPLKSWIFFRLLYTIA